MLTKINIIIIFLFIDFSVQFLAWTQQVAHLRNDSGDWRHFSVHLCRRVEYASQNVHHPLLDHLRVHKLLVRAPGDDL